MRFFFAPGNNKQVIGNKKNVRPCSLEPPLQRVVDVQNSGATTYLEQLQPVLHLPVLHGGDEPHDDVERQQDPTSPEQVYL